MLMLMLKFRDMRMRGTMGGGTSFREEFGDVRKVGLFSDGEGSEVAVVDSVEISAVVDEQLTCVDTVVRDGQDQRGSAIGAGKVDRGAVRKEKTTDLLEAIL